MLIEREISEVYSARELTEVPLPIGDSAVRLDVHQLGEEGR
ncbi:unnamed protein product, partial [marine sediment metagenome]